MNGGGGRSARCWKPGPRIDRVRVLGAQVDAPRAAYSRVIEQQPHNRLAHAEAAQRRGDHHVEHPRAPAPVADRPPRRHERRWMSERSARPWRGWSKRSEPPLSFMDSPPGARRSSSRTRSPPSSRVSCSSSSADTAEPPSPAPPARRPRPPPRLRGGQHRSAAPYPVEASSADFTEADIFQPCLTEHLSRPTTSPSPRQQTRAQLLQRTTSGFARLGQGAGSASRSPRAMDFLLSEEVDS